MEVDPNEEQHEQGAAPADQTAHQAYQTTEQANQTSGAADQRNEPMTHDLLGSMAADHGQNLQSTLTGVGTSVPAATETSADIMIIDAQATPQIPLNFPNTFYGMPISDPGSIPPITWFPNPGSVYGTSGILDQPHPSAEQLANYLGLSTGQRPIAMYPGYPQPTAQHLAYYMEAMDAAGSSSQARPVLPPDMPFHIPGAMFDSAGNPQPAPIAMFDPAPFPPLPPPLAITNPTFPQQPPAPMYNPGFPQPQPPMYNPRFSSRQARQPHSVREVGSSSRQGLPPLPPGDRGSKTRQGLPPLPPSAGRGVRGSSSSMQGSPPGSPLPPPGRGLGDSSTMQGWPPGPPAPPSGRGVGDSSSMQGWPPGPSLPPSGVGDGSSMQAQPVHSSGGGVVGGSSSGASGSGSQQNPILVGSADHGQLAADRQPSPDDDQQWRDVQVSGQRDPKRQRRG